MRSNRTGERLSSADVDQMLGVANIGPTKGSRGRSATSPNPVSSSRDGPARGGAGSAAALPEAPVLGERRGASGRALSRGDRVPQGIGVPPAAGDPLDERNVEKLMDLTPTSSDGSDVESRFHRWRDGYIYEPARRPRASPEALPAVAPVVVSTTVESPPMFKKEAVPAIGVRDRTPSGLADVLARDSEFRHRRARSEPARQLDLTNVDEVEDGPQTAQSRLGVAAHPPRDRGTSPRRSSSIKYETQMLAGATVGEVVRAIVKLCTSTPGMPELPTSDAREYEVRVLDEDDGVADLDFPVIDSKMPVRDVGEDGFALCPKDASTTFLVIRATDARSSTGRSIVKLSFAPAGPGFAAGARQQELAGRESRHQAFGGEEAAAAAEFEKQAIAAEAEARGLWHARGGRRADRGDCLASSSPATAEWHKAQMLTGTTVSEVIKAVLKLCSGESCVTQTSLDADPHMYDLRVVDEDTGEPDLDFPVVDRRSLVEAVGEDLFALCRRDSSEAVLFMKGQAARSSTGRVVIEIMFREPSRTSDPVASSHRSPHQGGGLAEEDPSADSLPDHELRRRSQQLDSLFASTDDAGSFGDGPRADPAAPERFDQVPSSQARAESLEGALVSQAPPLLNSHSFNSAGTNDSGSVDSGGAETPPESGPDSDTEPDGHSTGSALHSSDVRLSASDEIHDASHSTRRSSVPTDTAVAREDPHRTTTRKSSWWRW